MLESVKPRCARGADETGIVIIPDAHKAAVLRKADAIRESEDGRRGKAT
jgi:regulator of RNase E activity RraA